MNHTSKSDMQISQLNNQHIFEHLVRLEALLADFQANQRGKLYIYIYIYTHYYENIGYIGIVLFYKQEPVYYSINRH